MLINNIWIGSRITLYRCETTTKPHVIGLKQRTVYKCHNDYTNTIVTKKKKNIFNCAKIEETKRRTNNYFSIKLTKDASLYFYRRHSRAVILDRHEHSIALTRAHRLETFTSGHLGLP